MEQIKTGSSGNLLKGVTIAAVLVNHYLNMNVTGDSIGFANAWIAVFFVLSGYGLFHSLEGRFAENVGKKQVLLFYYHRMLRIFPLLWMAWLIELAVRGNNVSFWVPLGIHGSGHYWFIPALLQCYLLSPLLFWCTKKRSVVAVVAVTAMLAALNVLFLNLKAPHILVEAAGFINAQWRDAYFLYILLFTAGMAIAKIPGRPSVAGCAQSVVFWGGIFVIMAMMAAFKFFVQHECITKWMFNLFPLLPITLLCLYALTVPLKNRVFEFLGSLSYPIYLLHMSYYHFISRKGDFPKNSALELFLILLFFPLFIYMCQYLDRLADRISEKYKQSPPWGLDSPPGGRGVKTIWPGSEEYEIFFYKDRNSVRR